MISECTDERTRGVCLNNLGSLLQASRRFTEADGAYKAALISFEAAPGTNDSLIAQALSNRASMCREIDEYAEAERVFQISISIWNRVGWPSTKTMTTLDDCRDPRKEMIWSEFPTRDHLPKYGQSMQALRAEVLHEKTTSGDAHARLRTILKVLEPWRHNVQLTDGIRTLPEDFDYPATRWNVIAPYIPSDLSGKTVLDIGCHCGFFSTQLKRRGAERVVGIDVVPNSLAQARFLSHWFDLPMELLQFDAYGISELGAFDIVLFLGVLYHMKHPLYALEQIAKICKETMYFQSVILCNTEEFEPEKDYSSRQRAVFDHPAYPKLYFIETSLDGDASNWWGATRSCLKAMLRTSGFRIQDTSNPEIFVCEKSYPT